MYIQTNIDTPIFIQIAQQLEDAIFTGVFVEEAKIPSMNEIAILLNINPHTVLKGMNILVDEEMIYKKRGVGMYVKTGAIQKIQMKRQAAFYDTYIAALLKEAHRLAMSKQDIIELIEKGYDDASDSN